MYLPQCDNAMHVFVDDNTLEWLSLYYLSNNGINTSLQLYIVIAIKSVVNQCCKMVRKRVENIEQIRANMKVCTESSHSREHKECL